MADVEPRLVLHIPREFKPTTDPPCESRYAMDRPRGSGRRCSGIQTRTQTFFGDANDASSHAPVSSPVLRLGICRRISRWLWSGWRGAAFDTCPATAHTPSPRRIPAPELNGPLDCKACREGHVTCDRAWPQCSHCWQQQILCFYVRPRRKISSQKARHRDVIPAQVENSVSD